MGRKLISGAVVAAIIFWLIVIFLLVMIGIGSFVVPAMVSSWKAQGMTEAPLPWQIIVDLADFSKSRGLFLLPCILIMALIASYCAVFRKRQDPA